MKTFLFCILSICLSARHATAQTSVGPDTLYYAQLPNHDVVAARKWANDTAWYRYNQLKYNISVIIPYVNAGTILFYDINNKLSEPGLTKKDRKRYIAAREEEMRTKFESRIESLNETQGVLLIKLIARQTGLNIYRIISDFKGTFPALKYQTWARIHGLNLNRRYDPADEPEMEKVLFSMGYLLPSMYSVQR